MRMCAASSESSKRPGWVAHSVPQQCMPKKIPHGWTWRLLVVGPLPTTWWKHMKAAASPRAQWRAQAPRLWWSAEWRLPRWWKLLWKATAPGTSSKGKTGHQRYTRRLGGPTPPTKSLLICFVIQNFQGSARVEEDWEEVRPTYMSKIFDLCLRARLEIHAPCLWPDRCKGARMALWTTRLGSPAGAQAWCPCFQDFPAWYAGGMYCVMLAKTH